MSSWIAIFHCTLDERQRSRFLREVPGTMRFNAMLGIGLYDDILLIVLGSRQPSVLLSEAKRLFGIHGAADAQGGGIVRIKAGEVIFRPEKLYGRLPKVLKREALRVLSEKIEDPNFCNE